MNPEFVQNITTTITSLLILTLLYILFLFVLNRESIRINKKKIYKKRTLYILLSIFIFVFFKVWLHGFSHLFTILGIIGAALTITQKELLNNITGWFIILWRGLFAEGDYIKIQGYSGYVKLIGLFYFTLTSDQNNNKKSDEHIEEAKIPNGLVINNALINYSSKNKLFLSTIKVLFKDDIDPNKARLELEQICNEVLNAHYVDNKLYSEDLRKILKDKLKSMDNLVTSLNFSPHYKKPRGIKAKVKFYCFHKDLAEIEAAIQEKILLSFAQGKTRLAIEK